MLIICIVIFVKLTFNYQFIQDDAYTTFRYVKNFLGGKGLVFNTGEYVEGYTNFLWVIILSVSGYLGFNYVFVSQILSVCFGVLSLIVVYFISAKFVFISSGKSYQKIFAIFPVYLLAVNGSFIYWSVSGMETSLFVLLILLGFYFYFNKSNENKPNYLFVLFFVLSSFTRPEGILLFFLLFLFQLITTFRKKGRQNYKLKLFFVESLFFIIPILLFTLFRLIYYSYPFPNTFYAKTGLSLFYLQRGVKYFLSFINSIEMLSVVIPVLLIVPLFHYRIKQGIIELFLFVSFLYSVAIIIIGGDVLPMYRFFLPILPFLFIIFSKFLFELTIFLEDKIRRPKYIFLSLIIVSVLLVGFVNLKNEEPVIENYRGYEIGLVTKMKIYARWVKAQQNESGRTVIAALSTIGAFSFYSNVKVIDIIGLTDKYIAHHPVKIKGIENKVNVLWKEKRYNVDYVLQRKPTYIIFPAGLKPSAYPEAALFSRKEFQKNYYTQIFYSSELNQMLPVFTRKNAQQLKLVRASLFNQSCSIKFVSDYIEADNFLLNYIKTHNKKEKEKIITLSLKAARECKWAADKAYAALGTVYFYSANYEKARFFFEKAVKINPLSSVSHLYLKYIYFKLNDKREMLKHLIKLKEISPGALPSFVVTKKNT